MATDAEYAAYFLDGNISEFRQELVEISHPNFSKVYRLVATDPAGITVDLGGSEGLTAFEYFPLKITREADRNSLDQSIRIDLGDLGTVWPQEIDAVNEADNFETKPLVRYWTYRSDDLTKPLFGPLHLEVPDFSYTESGVSFTAKAPSLNVLGTGEQYIVSRFSPLRGTL